MNEFYILKPAVNTDETGPAYPAVESFQNYNFNAFNSMHKLKFYEFPEFVPDIRFKLAKGAKLCDLMSQSTISAHGLLIGPDCEKFSKGIILYHIYFIKLRLSIMINFTIIIGFISYLIKVFNIFLSAHRSLD